MKDSEVLREARSVLFDRGWYKGNYQAVDGRVCLIGACNIAAGLLVSNDNFWMASWLEPLRAVVGSPALFNDVSERTFDDVLDALELAEKHAEIHESLCSE